MTAVADGPRLGEAPAGTDGPRQSFQGVSKDVQADCVPPALPDARKPRCLASPDRPRLFPP